MTTPDARRCTRATTGGAVEEGRLLAALIPGARLVLLDSANHILLADEPAWQEFLVGAATLSSAPAPSPLPGRRRCRAQRARAGGPGAGGGGLTNEAIAERLCLSVRTVERHLSNIYVKLRVSGKAGRAAAAAAGSREPSEAARRCVQAAAGARCVLAPMPAPPSRAS